jgi:aromatic-amino-acid transaminase
MSYLASGSAFAALRPQAPDPLLSLIKLFREDPRPGKLDLGVGVYRDEAGATPVFQAVKQAETLLVSCQQTKSYLGPEGDLEFLDVLTPIVFGARGAADFLAVQTPGGTGALRLAAELVAAGRPGARIWMGAPSWPIHRNIFEAAGLHVETYEVFDPEAQQLQFAAMVKALETAWAGDVVLLHGCCHNPTGADPTLEQWRVLAEIMARRGLVPLIDLAYQGLGRGLAEDAAGLRLIVEAVDEVIVAYSLDKNFGLYRERTGALYVRSSAHADLVRANLLQLARCLWSMPPDHGAAVARTILQDEGLTGRWLAELGVMRTRLREARGLLAKAAPQLAPLAELNGLFALLPLRPQQVERLRSEHGVYMAASGRINLAGLTAATVPAFTYALNSCFEEVSA